MISQDIRLIVERLRELVDCEEMTTSALKVGLFNLEECADRVAEIEVGMSIGQTMIRERKRAAEVVRLEDFRRLS